MKDKLKIKEEDWEYSPFDGIEKATVLQDAKNFNVSKFVTGKPQECCQIITKLLYLVHHGEEFSAPETTDVFFGVSKLFQSKDPSLRRMLFLFLKQLAESTSAAEIIIVVASLVKDMTSNVDLNRANAIRVLSRIVDGSMLGQIERYIKQAIVDKNSMVASAALVSAMHFAKESPEIVRRWYNEITAAISPPAEMVQYHALSLLLDLRKGDQMAISKVVTKQIQARSFRESAFAECQLIRHASKMLQGDVSEKDIRSTVDFLEQMLHHTSELIQYEAARTICGLPKMADRDDLLSSAVTVLAHNLSSTKPTLRFSSVRTLNKVAMLHPTVVAKCNDEMETLITDSNRSIATLAITTLLKTGNEHSIERLMKQISSFMSEIADEFKIVVIDAIQSLCVKYPQKHSVLLNFLSVSLREEGGYEYKRKIVEAIIQVMTDVPQSKEVGLFHLCEFIEDCEFVPLNVRILNLLGEEVPKTNKPAKYIRFIFNRVILEKREVRAAAVTNLAKLGASVESLRKSVVMLLERCKIDDDNEVRDRASCFVSLLTSTSEVARRQILQPLPMSTQELSQSLYMYRQRPAPGPLTISALPVVDSDLPSAQVLSDGTPSSPGSSANEKKAPSVYQVPELTVCGNLFQSFPAVALCEEESEYVVHCKKLIFARHIVFQCQVKNTLDDQLLENVCVHFQSDDEMWDMDNLITVPAKTVAYNTSATCYFAIPRQTDVPISSSTFKCELKFFVKEVDPDTGEPDEFSEAVEDEWELEDVAIETADFMLKTEVPSFVAVWQKMGENNIQETGGFRLAQMSSVPEAVQKIITVLGMQPCENTGTVAEDARSHLLVLSGIFCGGFKVLVRAQVSMPTSGCILKAMVRSDNADVAKMVIEFLGE